MPRPDTANTKPLLRVLNLEDNASDSELIREELKTEWQEVELLRVETRTAFVAALEEFQPDVILSDFKLPTFDGRSALGIVRTTHPEIPVIMVTGALGDIEAVDLVKSGARDYVMKDHLQRLTAAVKNALSLEQGIRARKAAEKAMQQSEADLRTLVEHSPVAMIVDAGTGPDEKVLMLNRKFTSLFGYTLADVPDIKHWWPLAYPDKIYRESIESKWANMAETAIQNHGAIEPQDVMITCKDGSVRYVRISFSSIGDKNIATFEDMTERREAETKIKRLSQLYQVQSLCNQGIVRSKDENELFTHICETTVLHGGFKMAWIGLIDPVTNMVTPVASHGAGAQDYLHNIHISAAADSEYGNGPTGRCIRDNRPYWCQDFLTSPLSAPWRERGKALGWRSSAALPLRRRGTVIGAFMLYADVLNAFDDQACKLLLEMSDDINFALDNFYLEAERKYTEQELRLRAQIIDSTSDSVFLHDRQGQFVYLNAAAWMSRGYTLDELMAMNLHELDMPGYAMQIESRLDELQKQGHCIFESAHRCKDGSVMPVEVNARIIESGGRELVLSVVRNTTERKQAENTLRRSEEKYRTILENSNDMIWTVSPDGLFTFINKQAADATGLSIEDWLGKPFAPLVVEEDLPMILDIHQRIMHGEKVHYEIRGKKADGNILILSVNASPIFVDDKITGSISFARDITASKKAEIELRQLSLAVEQSPSSIVITDLDANIQYVNHAFTQVTGFSRDEVIGRNPRILHSGKNSRETYQDMWSHLVQGNVWQGELINRRKDGSEYIESVLISPVRNPQGVVTNYLAVKMDITQRKQAEAKLSRNAQRADGLLKINEVGGLLPEDEFLRFGLEWVEKLTGSSIAFLHFVNEDQESIELITWSTNTVEKYCTAFSDRHYPVSKAGIWADCLRQHKPVVFNDYAHYPDKHELPEGHSRLERLISVPVIEESKVRLILGVGNKESEYTEEDVEVAQLFGNDIWRIIRRQRVEAELKSAQQQLMLSEKMASIGLLAAGVAHEINNPVGYVNSNLGTLEKYLADIFVVMDKYEAVDTLREGDSPLQEELRHFKEKINLNFIREDTKSLISESHQGLDRVKKIIQDLKNFSHSDANEQWVLANVHHGLDSTLNVVWNELKYKCEVIKEYGVLPEIYCLPSQLNQVFMNLLVNAAQAIEVRGQITIRTGQEESRVWIEVSDTGKGIPPEHIPHLFDPFFTTKPIGKGTGLGLSVSYNIVKKHHGKIEIHSEVGKGSTFRVWLPMQQSDSEETA